MCNTNDCPLCALEDALWDLTAPVSEDDDVELFEMAQLGPTADKCTSTCTSGPFRDSQELRTQS